MDKKITEYKENDKSLNLKELGKYFHNDLTKDEDYFFLKDQNTKVLKQSIINMLDAYKNFFKTKSGFPKFKSKHDNKLSCRFPIEAISKRNDFTSERITLVSSLKNIKFSTSDKYTRMLVKHKDNIKSATLTKHKSGNYELSILVDTKGDIECLNENILQSEPNNDMLGIDLGITDFIVDSEGNISENIKSFRNNEKKIKKLSRELSKKQNGSNNKNKARVKLAKEYEKINNVKQNYLHHIVNKLISENQAISIENLNVSGMMKNSKLAKAIQELSLHEFKRILKYKADWYGRDIVEVDRFFPSSKQCSSCGDKNKLLKLSDREWTCTTCGTIHDRDLNAAINIMKEGMRLLPIRNGEYTPLEIGSVGMSDSCQPSSTQLLN